MLVVLIIIHTQNRYSFFQTFLNLTHVEYIAAAIEVDSLCLRRGRTCPSGSQCRDTAPD